MDNILLQKLADGLLNNWENKEINIESHLNSLLRRKSNKNVIFELSKAIEHRKFVDKNKAVLIVTLALIRRNLDCDEEVRELLRKYKLINLLYGGLIKLLDGKSDTFKFQISWNDNTFENKYEFIERFPAPKRWEIIDLFITVSILIKEDVGKFESILIKDHTDLLLLNYLHGERNWITSEVLLTKLLNDETNALRRNIGFYLLIHPIEQLLSTTTLETKKEKIDINNKVESFKRVFKNIPLQFQGELLINYFLTNKRAKSIPAFLTKEMMKINLTNFLVKEIKSSKIKTLDDIYNLLFIIKSIKRKSHGYKSYKNSLYDAILKKMREFIEGNKGIYFWDENTENLFRGIYSMLPKKYRISLEKSIVKTNASLMTSKLDELVRFNLFINDSNRAKVMFEMLKSIEKDKT